MLRTAPVLVSIRGKGMKWGEPGASAKDDRSRRRADSCVEAAFSRKRGRCPALFGRNRSCGESRQRSAAGAERFRAGLCSRADLHLLPSSQSARESSAGRRPRLWPLPPPRFLLPNPRFSGPVCMSAKSRSRASPRTALLLSPAILPRPRESRSTRMTSRRACASFIPPASTRPFRSKARRLSCHPASRSWTSSSRVRRASLSELSASTVPKAPP